MCVYGGGMMIISISFVYFFLWYTPVGLVDSRRTLETDCSDTFIPFLPFLNFSDDVGLETAFKLMHAF